MLQAGRLQNTNDPLVTKSKKETELVQKWVKFTVKNTSELLWVFIITIFLYEVCIHHGTEGYLPLGHALSDLMIYRLHTYIYTQ